MLSNENDIYMPPSDYYPMYSVNGVPYPLDEWLALQNKMTTSQAAELARRWPKENKK